MAHLDPNQQISYFRLSLLGMGLVHLILAVLIEV